MARSRNSDIQEPALLSQEEHLGECCPLARIIGLMLLLAEDPENDARALAFVAAVRMVWWGREWRVGTPLVKAITIACEVVTIRLRERGVEVV